MANDKKNINELVNDDDETTAELEVLVLQPSDVLVELEADGFLKFMVRNIVGTLVEVGLGKKSSEGFKEILLSKDRNLAGATAPPQGLFLMKVSYE